MEPNSGFVKGADTGFLIELIKGSQKNIHHQKVIPVHYQPKPVHGQGSFPEGIDTVDMAHQQSKQERIDDHRDQLAEDAFFFAGGFSAISLSSRSLSVTTGG